MKLKQSTRTGRLRALIRTQREGPTATRATSMAARRCYNIPPRRRDTTPALVRRPAEEARDDAVDVEGRGRVVAVEQAVVFHVIVRADEEPGQRSLRKTLQPWGVHERAQQGTRRNSHLHGHAIRAKQRGTRKERPAVRKLEFEDRDSVGRAGWDMLVEPVVETVHPVEGPGMHRLVHRAIQDRMYR